TVPNHLYVYAQASTATFSQLLNVQINDYALPGNTFYAPDSVPTLPADVSADVTWIAGLSSQDKVQTNHTAISGGQKGSAPQSSPPYSPVSYATAYDVNPLLNAGYNGAGTNIAITLWLVPPNDGALNYWAGQTGAPVATVGNGRLSIIKTDGVDGEADDGEAGLDIESTSGMASHAHINYYEASAAQFSNLAHALNVAGTNASN